MLTYQAGRNDTAPVRDEFDQFLLLRDSGLNLEREQPDNQYEGFLRASTNWARGDLQLIAGEFNDNNLSVERIEAIIYAKRFDRNDDDRGPGPGF